MKKILLVMMVVLFSMGVTGTAFAGVYFSGNLAYVMVEDSALSDSDPSGMPPGLELSYDDGYGITLAVGSEMQGFRVEGELAYSASDMDAASLGTVSVPAVGDVSTTSLVGNIFKDFDTNSPFSPFVGLGLGMSMVEGKLDSIGGVPTTGGGDDDDTVFAYQLMLGCAYKLNDNLNLDLSYRYFVADDPTFDTVTVEVASHNILAGVRVAF